LRYTLVGHPREITAITISPDKQTLITASPDGQTHFWQLADGKHLQLIDTDDWANDLTISHDNKIVINLGAKLTTWDIATGSLLKKGEFTSEGSIHNSFSPDHHFIVSNINNEMINLWEIEAQKKVGAFTKAKNRQLGAIALHPNGRILAEAQNEGLVDNQNPIFLWDLPSSKKLQTLSGKEYHFFTILFSPDGKILAIGSEQTNFPKAPPKTVIKLWDWQKGILTRTLTSQEVRIQSMVFSQDGQLLAMGTSKGNIQVWNVQTGQVLATLTGHTEPVNVLVFDMSGKILVSGSDDRTIKVWQLD